MTRTAIFLACTLAALCGCGSAESEGPGSLTGTVSRSGGIDCSVAPDDCVGPVFLYVVAEDPVLNPAQTPEAIVVLEAADLSGTAAIPFSFVELPAGTWYLAAFQDDDENASRLAPTPDRGDPIPYPFPRFSVEPGRAATVTLVLSVRTP